MTIDELLDVMDETLEEAVNLPFTGGKRMVDVENCLLYTSRCV